MAIVDFGAEACAEDKVIFRDSKLCELRASAVKYLLNIGYRAPQ